MTTYSDRQANHTYPDFGGHPKGNASEYTLDVIADSTGALVLNGIASGAPFAIGDVLDRFHLCESFEVTDMQAVVVTAAGQAMTVNVGFRYTDGIDDPLYPQADNFYFAALALNAAARTRMSTAKLTKPFPKPAQLVLVAAGANLASPLEMQLIVRGVQR